MKNRLQLRYHLPKFPFTREQALEYIKTKFEKEEKNLKSLVAEPLIVFYGDDVDTAKVILAIGRDGDGVEILKNAPYFTIDSAKLEEDIKKLQAESGNYKDWLQKVYETIGKILEDTKAIHTELDNTQLGAGLEIDGSYAVVADANYISASKSLKEAIIALDSALKSEETARINKDNELQSELDNTQGGAGLLPDGSYNNVETLKTNYLKDSKSLFESEKIIDAELKTISNDLNSNKKLVDNIRKSAGFNSEGLYVKPIGSNFLGEPTTLHEADSKLDDILGNVRDAAGLELDGTYKPCTSEMHHINKAESLMDADMKLDMALFAEEKRATKAEEAITASIGNEKDGVLENTVYGHINANKKAIEDETLRASNKENEILKTIGSEKDTPDQVTVFGKINANKSAIETETSRAKEEEVRIVGLIDAEKLRADTAEKALDGKIDAEKLRASTAEGNLDKKIDSETTTARKAEELLGGRIDDETERATLSENEIKNLTVNGKKISTNPILDATNVHLNGYTIASDITIHSDDSIQSAIGSLEKRNVNNETDINTNAENIVKERDRAVSEEGRLEGLIEAEAALARGEEGKLNQLIADEAKLARGEEGKLQSAIDSESKRALEAEKILQTAISTEETRATKAEETLQKGIDAETDRAEKAEAVLQTNITAEETRATTKESELVNEDKRLETLIGGNASNIEKNKVVSSDKSVTITSGKNTDLSVNIDGETIVKSENGKLSVASDKLVQYQGENAIKVSEVKDGVKKISLALNSTDHILTNTDNGLLSTISLEWPTDGDSILLKGKDDFVISKVPVAKFIKDGILDSVELVTDPSDQPKGTYLKFTWNVDAGQKVTYVNVTSLIDLYESGNGVEVVDKASKEGKTVKVINLVIDGSNSEKDSQGVSYLIVDGKGLRIQGVNGEIAKEANRATNVENAIKESISTTNENLTQEIANRKSEDIRIFEDSKVYTNGQIFEVKSLVSDEKDRAISEEGKLKRLIEAEATLAREKEGNLNTSIQKEISDRGSEITRVEGLVNSEKETRISEDSRVEGLVETEKSERSKDIEKVEGLITAEATRADIAEKANAKLISEEVKRSKEVDSLHDSSIATINEKIDKNTKDISEIKGGVEVPGSISSLIDVETKRAKEAEEVNAKAIESETSRAKEEEGKLRNSIQKEITDRGSEITRVEGLVNKEVTDRTNEITRVSGLVEAENGRAVLAESGLRDSISLVSDKASANEQAITVINGSSEGSIQKAVENEAKLARAAEQANTKAIEAEAKTAREAEKVNRDNITNEIDRAKEAERLIGLDVKSISEKLGSEVTRSSNKDKEFDEKFVKLFNTDVIKVPTDSINHFIISALKYHDASAPSPENVECTLIRKIEGTNTFYVSNLAEDINCTFNGQKGVTIQNAINTLLEKIKQLEQDNKALEESLNNLSGKALTPDSVDTVEKTLKVTKTGSNGIVLGFADDAIFGNTSL